MKKIALVAFFILQAATSPGAVRTDLGVGNAYVAEHFQAYKNGSSICASPSEDRPRVLISGFGPFSGSSSNISGEVLKHFGNFQAPASPADVYGASREIQIDGELYQICFLVTATTWDLAAAILVSEAELFQPQFILMTGLGGYKFILETSAINVAASSGGYSMDGNFLLENKPLENYVLPVDGEGVLAEISLSWNADAAKTAIEAKTTALGFTSAVESMAVFPDNYICNNIRFVVAHAVLNVPIELAGGLVQINPNFPKAPLVGFAHYPQNISLETSSLEAWTQVLAGIVIETHASR